jgi:quinol monooxygenase YgiN
VLVVTRYRVAADDVEAFRSDAEAALAVLVARPGCTGGLVGRAVDDAGLWTVTTTWESVGAYRRALGGYEVKLVAVPLMYRAIDEPTAYEHLVTWSPSAGLATHSTSLAADADVIGIGEAATPLAPRDVPDPG